MTKRNSAVVTEAPAQAQAQASADQPIAQAAPAWSETDESLFQEMQARRKATKAKRPAGASRSRLGDDTVLLVGPTVAGSASVFGTIRAAVAGHGDAGIARAVLLDQLAKAEWQSSAAKPGDRGWLAGWVAGAVRAGVLVVRAAAPAAP